MEDEKIDLNQLMEKTRRIIEGKSKTPLSRRGRKSIKNAWRSRISSI